MHPVSAGGRVDPKERFTGTVAQYAVYRPDYPDALFTWLAALTSGRRAVDLGAGTGIFTRALAAHGWEVVGIEPNAAMRAAAAGVRCVEGSAEATGLREASADLVVAAQAFHWFDPHAALREIDRILAPGGSAAAVWNVRAEHGFAAAYEDVLLRWSTEYPRVPKPGPTLAALRALRPGGRAIELPHEQRLDEDGILGRAWSSSYVVHGVSDRAGFDRDLLDAAQRHRDEDGRITLAYVTVGYAWAGPRVTRGG